MAQNHLLLRDAEICPKNYPDIAFDISGTTTQGVTDILKVLALLSTATVNSPMRQRSEPAIICLKLKIETLEQGMKYVQN